MPGLPLQLPDPITLDLFGDRERWPAPPAPLLRLPRWVPQAQETLLESVGWADVPRWGEEEDARLARSLDPHGLPRPLTPSRWLDLAENDVPPSPQLRLRGRERVGAVVSTRQALVVRNRVDKYLVQVADPGFSVVHVATGLLASFFVEHDGFGTVFAKSYQNSLTPRSIPSRVPQRFWGHGVGGRLYRAAGVLWPQVRWRDDAVRSTSAHLRVWLHAADPWVWESATCACRPLWWRGSREEVEAFSHAQPRARH